MGGAATILALICSFVWYIWVGAFAFKALAPNHIVGRRPPRSRIVYGILALLPVVWYASDYLKRWNGYQRQRTHIADLSRSPRPTNPGKTLVIFGAREPWQDELIEAGALDTIYVSDWKTRVAGEGPWIRIGYARSPKCLDTSGLTESTITPRARSGFLACASIDAAAAAPADGLHLRISNEATATLRRTLLEGTGPYELHSIQNGSDTIVGYWERAYATIPKLPPVFIGIGYWQRDMLDTENPRPELRDFVIERLSLDVKSSRPSGQPSAEDIRTRFRELATSGDAREREAAAVVAKATGKDTLLPSDLDLLRAAR